MALNPHPLSDPSPVEVIPADEAAPFLAELGISVSGIQNVLLDAVDAASLRDDPYWANTARGIELWSNLVHGVRQLLNEDKEWTVDNPQNRPVMVRDGGCYEFALAGGDSGTGNPVLQPGFARNVGKATTQAANRFSQEDPGALIPLRALLAASESSNLPHHPFGTWILLYRCTTEAIYSEISVPAHISSDGELESWRLRVLLPIITDLGDKLKKPLPDNLDDDLDFFIA